EAAQRRPPPRRGARRAPPADRFRRRARAARCRQCRQAPSGRREDPTLRKGGPIMPFRFKLERVLHHVRIRETMKRMEVSSLVQRVAFLERRKDEAERAKHEGLARIDRLLFEERRSLEERK